MVNKIINMEIIQVTKEKLYDSTTYNGYGYYSASGNFIPHGCGKKFYKDHYAYGNFNNGILDGPAIISHNRSMKTCHFSNNDGNGWGLCMESGYLTEFGYYENNVLKVNLLNFVEWYFDVLLQSGRTSENMLHVYNYKETKKVAELMIGFTGGINSYGLESCYMGFRFTSDGSIWIGNTQSRILSGILMHFTPNGKIEVGDFINGKLQTKYSLREIMDSYDSFCDVDIEINSNINYFNSQYSFQNKDFVMEYTINEVKLGGSNDFQKIDDEKWLFGEKSIDTPYGELEIEDVIFIDKGSLVGVQITVSGELYLNKNDSILSEIHNIATIAIMRQPHNAWLWVYVFDDNDEQIAVYCGFDDMDKGLAEYVFHLRRRYE